MTLKHGKAKPFPKVFDFFTERRSCAAPNITEECDKVLELRIKAEATPPLSSTGVGHVSGRGCKKITYNQKTEQQTIRENALYERKNKAK